MRNTQLRLLCLFLAAMASLATTAFAQDPDEAAVKTKAARILTTFGRFAESKKVGTRAKQAYEEVLRDYDPDNAAARRALGFKQVKGAWKKQPPKAKKPNKRGRWEDASNDKQRYQVSRKWRDARMGLAKLHRERGLAIIDSNKSLGSKHLRRAVIWDPFDNESHTKLGHVKSDDGYFGSKDQVEFVRNLKRVEKQALVLAKKKYKITPVKDIPIEMALVGKEVHGAKSDHFTVFTRGTQKNADDCAMWAERGLDFLKFCLGDEYVKRTHLDKRIESLGWFGFIWTPREREKLIAENRAKNPDSALVRSMQGKDQELREKLFNNLLWIDKNKRYEIVVKLTPASMHDTLISTIWSVSLARAFGGFDANQALTEGAMHAATWYLMSTAMTKRGTLPKGTASSLELVLPESVNWWMREMRDQATARTDMPANELPRVTLDNFPARARIKTWSFMTWLIARYPKKWFEFITTVPSDKRPFPSEVDKVAEAVFERSMKDIEEEWRVWASGRGVTAAATGYGPPLLPTAPNAGQLAGLKRLNEFRAQHGLPPCELDLEATVACVEHAKFLAQHKEHHTWPEAHEQDPAKSGFTPRGMRAGMRSVIVINARNAADSLDSWIGTVYHRFPLLKENIRRIGFAFETGKEGAMCVLDMGSLQEPYRVGEDGKWKERKWIEWPPPESKGWPIGFAYHELPNPVGEVPAPHNDQTKVGYPVSLQLGHFITKQLSDASISMWKVRKQGGKWKEVAEVPLHQHTPFKALHSRMEEREVVFGIPKVLLQKRTWYRVDVKLVIGNDTERVSWAFQTGTKRK